MHILIVRVHQRLTWVTSRTTFARGLLFSILIQEPLLPAPLPPSSRVLTRHRSATKVKSEPSSRTPTIPEPPSPEPLAATCPISSYTLPPPFNIPLKTSTPPPLLSKMHPLVKGASPCTSLSAFILPCTSLSAFILFLLLTAHAPTTVTPPAYETRAALRNDRLAKLKRRRLGERYRLLVQEPHTTHHTLA